LLIFLKFITSVIPTVEFDITGDLIFEWVWSDCGMNLFYYAFFLLS
jgi:hypothetical protein